MNRIRKLADGISALCNGAEDEKEFNDGVNISLIQLNIDANSACNIRKRLNVGNNTTSVNSAEFTEFLLKLSKKHVQYSRLSDSDVKKLVGLTTVNIDAKKLMTELLTELLIQIDDEVRPSGSDIFSLTLNKI